MDLGIYSEGESTVFGVVKLGAHGDVAGNVGLGDATCSGEGVKSHDGKHDDSDKYANGEDAER